MKWFASLLLGLALAAEAIPQSLAPLEPPVDRSTRVTVSPETATPSDDISVTVSRWVQSSWRPAGSTVQTLGNIIRVDVHWELLYTLVAVPPHREEYTVSLGKRKPGTYSVLVTNDDDGARADSGFAHFTVIAGDTEPSSTGGSLIDLLFGSIDTPDSSGESAIDRLKDLLDESPFGDGVLHGYPASLQ
jgi:hypothetical protein